MSPSTMDSWAKDARLVEETSGIAKALTSTIIAASTSDISDGLGHSSIVRGLNPANKLDAAPKEVRFNEKVNVIKIPDVQQMTKPANVTFSDDIVNIDTAAQETRATASSPKKRVRFSCLKHPKQPVSHGLTLLQMLKHRGHGPTIKAPVLGKKHVRFGALKCQKSKYANLTFGHRDSEWDEAETRRIFKRECTKNKDLQPLSSLLEGEAEDDWDST